jgi:hypothetical protein
MESLKEALFKLQIAMFALFALDPKDPKFFANSKAVMEDVLGAVITIVIVIMLDIYVLGNDNIINSQSAIGSVVVPILQAVLLIIGILVAIGLLYTAAEQGTAK